MVADLETARSCVHVDRFNEGLLISPARPIVPLPRRRGSPIAPGVSPGSRWVGVMLPYARLHHVLFARGIPPLVVTSGHCGGEPLAASKREAIERARDLADASLTHAPDLDTRLSAWSGWQPRTPPPPSSWTDYRDPGP
jgi:hydrogenase maturation protein HypF